MPLKPLFPLGQLLATPGALDALAQNNQTALPFLVRHNRGDWGELDPEDQQANLTALLHDLRLLSAYRLADNTKIWIITEADRSATTILLPSEY